MSSKISNDAMAILFDSARTHSHWRDESVAPETLRQLYDAMKWGPTSMNGCPARIKFLSSDEARARLRPHLARGNVEQTMSAPVVAIIGYDTRFHERLAELFPHNPRAASYFSGEDTRGFPTAFRNSSLQGAYLIIAARAIGLDCGPMSGFDAAGVDAEFWPGGRIRTNFLCNLGYADHERVHPRLPRLAFDEVCEIL